MLGRMTRPAEICKVDSSITALNCLKIGDAVTSLNLHHNGIMKIEALDHALHLQRLDLSSNLISRMEGLDKLLNLNTLNLSSNVIRKLEGIEMLRSLVRLDLSFNVIDDLEGLKGMHGPNHRLTVLQLQGNRLNSFGHVIQHICGLENLRQLTLDDPQAAFNNPLCALENYRQSVLDALPQLVVLDNFDRSGRSVQVDIFVDYPELKDLMEFVVTPNSTEVSEEEEPTREQGLRSSDQHETSDPHQSKPAFEGSENKLECTHTNLNNMNAEGRGTSNKHSHCVLASSTERRLANLENQLSSLMAMQLNCFGQPGDVCREDSFDTTGNTGKIKPTRCELGTPKLGSAGEGYVDNGHVGRSIFEPENNLAAVNSTKATVLHAGETLEVPPSRLQAVANAVQSPSPVSFSSVTSRECQRAVAEEHPGAPKKPTTVRSSARSNGHPVHGKPMGNKRPNSALGTNYVTTAAGIHDQPSISKSPVRKSPLTQRRLDSRDSRSPKTTEDRIDKTIGQLLQELDTERAQRKATEQACRELADHVRRLEAAAADEAKVLEATQKLKQAFAAEHRARLDAESRLRELDGRLLEVSSTLDVIQAREEAEKLRVLEETNKMSTRLMELARDYEKAVTRAEQAEKKTEELNCLLQTRDSENKALLDKRFALDSPEVNQLIGARIEAAEARHEQTIRTLNEKLQAGEVRYQSLEEEFRMALRIEADRYGELCNATGALKQQLSDMEKLNKDLEQREQTAQQLISELTNAIKEQKTKAASQQKSSLLVQNNQKERIINLEAQLQEAQHRVTVIEALRKENKQLKAELVAQESLVMGLRAERRNWGEELAQQGSSLAQDRGRLEAKVEAQAEEIISLKKNLEQQTDNVKIKSKIIDDQTESIRDLKKSVAEKQNELKRAQDDAVAAQRRLEDQLVQLKKEADENMAKLERLITRKEELKETVIELESENEELQAQNESLNQRWCDRTNLLDKLEKQVELMRQTWEQEQQTLINERDDAKERVNQLQTQIEQMELDYQRQLELMNEAKNAAISTTQREAELLRSNCESRVAEVESEMRAVLLETEQARNAMEARLRKLSLALIDSATLTGPPLRHCYSSQSNHWNNSRGVDVAPSFRPTSEASNAVETVNPSSANSAFVNLNDWDRNT